MYFSESKYFFSAKALALLFFCLFLIPTAYPLNKLNIDSIKNSLAAMPDDTNKVNSILRFTKHPTQEIPADVIISFLKEALEIEKKFKFKKRLAYLYRQLGNTYFEKLHNYEKALEYYFTSLKIVEEINDKAEIANCFNNIGNVYTENAVISSNSSFYIKALEYHEKALRIREALNEPQNIIANSYLNMSNIYKNIKEYEKALSGYKKCIKIYTEFSDFNGLTLSYISMGELYLKKEVYDSALIYFNEYLQNPNHDKAKRNTSYVYSMIGKVYFNKNDFTKSKKYFNEALELAKTINEKDVIKTSYEYLSEIYSNEKNYENAYKYYRLYSEIKDTILNIESINSITRIQNLYEVENKEKEIDALKQEKEIQDLNLRQQELEISQKRYTNTILISLLAFIIVIVLLSFNRLRLKQKEALIRQKLLQQELSSKAIIEAEQNERMRIAKDLHDSLGQLMSAAKLNISGLESSLQLTNKDQKAGLKNASNLIDECVKEIRTISHNMMPNALTEKGLTEALKDYLNKINSSGKIKINFHLHNVKHKLEPTKEVVLFRIIQEIISNIIKHANATTAELQLIEHENELTIMIEDDGSGFETNRINEFKGIGLKNIQSRVSFLKGIINLDSSPGAGTTITIDIPLK